LYYHRDSRLIFIHIPKTAGASITYMLRKTLGKNNTPQNAGPHSLSTHVYKLLGKKEWNNCWSFGVIRNPWDRIVSHYKYHVSMNRAGGKRFGQWLFSLPERGLLKRPQYNYLFDFDDTQLVDDIFRFERLHELVSTLELRLDRSVRLPHCHKSKRRPYREMYNGKTRRFVERVFESDIETFGYRF
jgi:chondroitin 4-sulfotransferase 11